jgi:hypothetical protein
VYDALNVLMAMNIISKEKKEIRWIGLPTNSAQECQHIEVRCIHTTVVRCSLILLAPFFGTGRASAGSAKASD